MLTTHAEGKSYKVRFLWIWGKVCARVYEAEREVSRTKSVRYTGHDTTIGRIRLLHAFACGRIRILFFVVVLQSLIPWIVARSQPQSDYI